MKRDEKKSVSESNESESRDFNSITRLTIFQAFRSFEQLEKLILEWHVFRCHSFQNQVL